LKRLETARTRVGGVPEWLGKDAFVALVRELGPEIPESRIYLRDAVTVRPFWWPFSLRCTHSY
jgi:hypothetical protein